MSRQEIKYRKKQRRAKEAAKRRIVLLLATVLLITIGSIIFGSTFSAAHAGSEESGTQFKYYKSIELQAGDSLWGIAEEYKAADESTQDYIDELMELNNLKNERIHQGQHLVVVYYDTEFR